MGIECRGACEKLVEADGLSARAFVLCASSVVHSFFWTGNIG